MKRLKFVLIVVLCLIMTACSNDFAKQEYNSDEKIAQTEDKYTKDRAVYTQVHWGCIFTADKFDGRESLWIEPAEKDNDREVTFTFNLSKGKAKVVQIDEDDNVTTVIECLPESTEEDTIKTVTLKKGKNRFKVVGYDCEDLYLKMKFEKTVYHKKKD